MDLPKAIEFISPPFFITEIVAQPVIGCGLLLRDTSVVRESQSTSLLRSAQPLSCLAMGLCFLDSPCPNRGGGVPHPI